MVQARTFEQQIGIAKETTPFTGVNPTVGMPITGGTLQAMIEEIYDEGRRGVASADFAAIQGAGHGEFSLEGFVYPESIGWLLKGMLGGEAVTGAGDPYEHEFSAAATPPTFTIEDTIIGGSNGGLRLTGSTLGSLGFSFDAGAGVLAYTSQWMGGIPSKVTPQALTFPTTAGLAGWRAAVTSTNIASRIASGEINISRELQVVHTGTATQGPRNIAQGPIRVEGSFLLSLEDLTDFDRYLTDLTQSFVVVFDKATDNRRVEFTMTECNFNAEPWEPDRGGVAVFQRLSFRAIHNSTDGGPLTAIVENSRATAY